jgi:flagellar motor switch protein FliN/FliY
MPASPSEEITHVADVVLALEVELDRKRMRVREILDLAPGGVIKMERSAGENIDILVDQMLIGFGEIVIIEDAMGVRITDFRSDE